MREHISRIAIKKTIPKDRNNPTSLEDDSFQNTMTGMYFQQQIFKWISKMVRVTKKDMGYSDRYEAQVYVISPAEMREMWIEIEKRIKEEFKTQYQGGEVGYHAGLILWPSGENNAKNNKPRRPDGKPGDHRFKSYP